MSSKSHSQKIIPKYRKKKQSKKYITSDLVKLNIFKCRIKPLHCKMYKVKKKLLLNLKKEEKKF